MSVTPAKRILLQLTDLHFGPAKAKGHYWNSESTELQLPRHDRRGLLGSLILDLKGQELRPDLVLVTGDLLDRGARAGVKLARRFLADLAEELELPPTRIVIVPGNHDVLRVPDPAQQYKAFDAIRKGLYQKSRAPFRAGTQPYHRVEVFDFADPLGLEVVAFNSCEALKPPKQEHGSVGQAQRDRAAALLQPTEGKGLFRIALMHHHLARPKGVVREDFSVMDDDGLVREWLAKHRFQLALHGHQHVDCQDFVEVGDWRLAISAGGSAGVAAYGRSEWHLRLGYQVIVIDTPESGRRIRREYDPQSRTWIAAGGDPAETPLQFGKAASVGATAAPAGGAGARAGQGPTKASLRLLLDEVFRLPEELDAFCIDHFPVVAKSITGEMGSMKKVNVLLTAGRPAEILARLRQVKPDKVREHEGLLAYE